MSKLVGNPEDRFSRDAAQLSHVYEKSYPVYNVNTSMQYTATFVGCKNHNFQINNGVLYSTFRSLRRLWILVRTVLLKQHFFDHLGGSNKWPYSVLCIKQNKVNII